ncbi:LAQU0S06e00276g1_1 [Lachancea quebecensis]|uniref:LAQU0S06e00276g1_1 n=1 Tax=Lachancea quebecensis TaxID=1654605 RepID=A0A0P1KS00_9SACH|nr:LAQU0S06e00276g1_1 [Lachancea quebecensis]
MRATTWLATSVLALAKFCSGSHLDSIERKLGVEVFDIPSLNLSNSKNNEIQLLGNFKDINLYRYSGQSNFTGEISGNSKNALIYYSNETFLEIYSPSNSSEDFSIDHIVPFKDDAFILSGTGPISGHQLSRQVFFNLSSLEFREIFDQDLSRVNTITTSGDKVFFGGSFEYMVSNQTVHSLLVWDYTKDDVETLPFGGFGKNSSVNSILNFDNSNMLFAGNFSTIDVTQQLNNISNSNTSNSSVPELGHQVSLQSASWVTGGTLDTSAIICPSSESALGWLQTDSTQGQFEINMQQETRPSKLRIYNADNSDEQVSLFRIVTTPSNGIMNLTYLDPATGELASCDAWCPLLSGQNLTDASYKSDLDDQAQYLENRTTLQWSESYQDFAFVNNVPVSDLTFIALDSYGSSVGLTGIEIYESAFSVYANNTLNAPNCAQGSVTSSASLSNSSTWYSNPTGGSYLSSSVQDSQTNPFVIFYPSISYPGIYRIDVLTPGCLDDSSCESRGIINATIRSIQNNTVLASIEIYQNNDYEKFDTLYSGFLDSEVKVTIEFDRAINSGIEIPIMVAGKLVVNIEEFDDTVLEKNKSGVINGLLHYSTSNTSSFLSGLESHSATDLTHYSVSKLPKNSNIFANMFEDNLILLTTDGEMARLKLAKNFSIEEDTSETIGNNISGVNEYSDGLVVVGSFNGSSEATAKGFNGSFFDLGDLNSTVKTFANLTLEKTEMLVFDQSIIFNGTTGDRIYNTSNLTLRVASAGKNSLNDTLFQGLILKNDFSGLNGSFFISARSEEASQSFEALGGTLPYNAAFINNSATAYAYYNPENTSSSFGVSLLNDSGEAVQLSEWSGKVGAMTCSKNESLLAIGGKDQYANSQLLVANTSTGESLSSYTWDSEISINSLIFFAKNDSLLVGGSFEVNSTQCSGLCLFDYQDNEWSPFLNNSIRGVINGMEIVNNSNLLIAGLFKLNETEGVSLASVSLKDGSSEVLHEGNITLNGFVSLDGSLNNIVAFSDTSLLQLESGSWQEISSNFTENSKYKGLDVFLLKDSTNKQKRDSSNKVLLITGSLQHSNYGTIDAAFYDSGEWTPFLSSTQATSSSALDASHVFLNRDLSAFLNYDGYLQGTFSSNTSGGTSGNPSPSGSSPSNLSGKKGKIDRGFIVLISLALALGTLAVLGLLGVIFSYFFGDSSDGYQLSKPRTDENEMIDTVPPEKLMRFI